MNIGKTPDRAETFMERRAKTPVLRADCCRGTPQARQWRQSSVDNSAFVI
jgi:hypothetical protein